MKPLQAIVVQLVERIELMVVAARTAHRQPQEHRGATTFVGCHNPQPQLRLLP